MVSAPVVERIVPPLAPLTLTARLSVAAAAPVYSSVAGPLMPMAIVEVDAPSGCALVATELIDGTDSVPWLMLILLVKVLFALRTSLPAPCLLMGKGATPD